LQDVAHEIGGTLNQVIIAWLRQSDPPILSIIGGSTPEQLAENLGALALELTPEQLKRLQEAGA